MKAALLLIALLLPVALAAAVPKPLPPIAPPAPVILSPGPSWNAMSPEGRVIANRIYNTPDPRAGPLNAEIAALRTERAKLIAASPIDVDALDALLRKDEDLQAERRKRSNDKLIELVRALPEGDKAILLKSLAAPARPAR